jgi:hypothetical protein
LDPIYKVSVYDADTFTTSDMIGCYQFDLLGIYFRQDHELYKQWVALVDPTNTEDAGTQGYLKLSVTVLGPGDTQKVSVVNTRCILPLLSLTHSLPRHAKGP